MAIFENKGKTDIYKLLTMSMGEFGYRTGPFLKSMVGKTFDKKSYKEDQTNKEKENDTHQFCVLLFNFNQLLTIKDSEINTTSYKVLFRLNHDLFADILQKFSSHASRLGTSVIGF